MNKLVVISGPSGVGKGTIVKILQKRYQDEGKKLYLSISCTTRNIREGEQNGIDYYFISEKDFIEKINDNDFLEYNKYGTGKYYGTPKSTVIDYLNNGYDVILEIDINGYKQIKENYPDCVGIFIMPPSLDDLYHRLRKRGTETEEIIEKRVQTAKTEICNNDIYDYIVVNPEGQSDNSAVKVYNIINNRKYKA